MTKTFEEQFGMRACYDAVAREIEQLGGNPFEMLGRYIVREEQDAWFNETMIEALKKYIVDKNIRWDDKIGG